MRENSSTLSADYKHVHMCRHQRAGYERRQRQVLWTCQTPAVVVQGCPSRPKKLRTNEKVLMHPQLLLRQQASTPVRHLRPIAPSNLQHRATSVFPKVLPLRLARQQANAPVTSQICQEKRKKQRQMTPRRWRWLPTCGFASSACLRQASSRTG